MWLNWQEINEVSTGKEIIFFGRGNWALKTYPYLVSKAICIIDNNPFEWGQIRENNLTVYDPILLDTIDWNNHFIIITTSHFDEVQQQLQTLGMVPGKHFCISPALKNHRAQMEINQQEATIYLTCSDHFVAGAQKYGGGLYKFHIPSCTLTKLINGICHGVIQAGDYFFLVDDSIAGLRKLNSKFEPLEQFELPVGSCPHGIAYCPKRNWIFVNLSDHDSIAIYDAESYQPVKEIRLSEKRWKMGTSQHHVNDVLVYEDSLYVTMFSFSGNWKLGIFDGGVLEFDIDSGEQCPTPLVSDLWMPHTPTIIRGKLWYTDSMRGKVYCGTEELPIEFNGFVRGIAYDDKFYYVGQSLHRHPDRLRKISHNISLDTGVFLIHKKSNMTRFFPTPTLTDINTIFIPSKLTRS